MTKSLALAALVSLVTAAGALAQADGAAGGSPSRADPRSNHVTSTGATVPHPGASQGGGTTPLDVGVQREDDKIESSICKGC